MSNQAEVENNDQQFMNDLNDQWLQTKWGKFSGSNVISLMGGIDDPELLGATKLKMVHEAIKGLTKDQIGKTGTALIGPMRDILEWSKPISAEELKYAYKQLDPYTEGLKTYAEKVAVQSMTKYSPDPELTKPWIIRGREHEVPGIKKLEGILNMDFINIGHDQKFIDHSTIEKYGCTPDGISEDGKYTLEGKCPNSETHLKYRGIKDNKTLKEIMPNYYWQMQSQMDCNGNNEAIFFSYDDRFEEKYPDLVMHFCYIKRDDIAIKQIHKRLEMAHAWRNAFINQHIGN